MSNMFLKIAFVLKINFIFNFCTLVFKYIQYYDLLIYSSLIVIISHEIINSFGTQSSTLKKISLKYLN